MSATRYDHLQEIFRAACRLDPAEREPFLDRVCNGDANLRAEAEALLEADAEAEVALDIVVADGGAKFLAGALAEAGDLDVPEPSVPERIGAYRILGELGRGGMGVVYEAEQDEPKRRVALKVVRSSMVTRGLLQRFRHEGRVLGHLRHPGIAQVYEAGSADTSDGRRPYFAMELVEGPSLTAYADARGLDTRTRLELIAQLCDILHYAHQKGVIHRDLKPANVLVTDEVGSRVSGDSSIAATVQLKVLDFGVARATDADLHTVTLQTSMGQLIGTVPYMSPEQASGDPAQIDVRSDVYSVGVVAYELLTGRFPYEVRGKLIHEAVRIVREHEPSSLSADDRSLRGDIETIVLRALEKDKTRRYQSAAELADDIRRHLRDEPIRARPASAMYQLGKFAQRNKAVVGGAVASLLIAVIGAVVATSFAVSATRRADLLERASYVSGLSAAASAMAQLDDAAARTALDGTPEQHRGWEYDLLRARLERHTELLTPPTPIGTSLQFEPDTGRMVGIMTDGTIGWWDDAGRLVDSTPIGLGGGATDHLERDANVQLHPSSRRIAVTSPAGPGRIGSLDDGTTLATIPAGALVHAWTADGARLLYADDATRLWDADGSTDIHEWRARHGAFDRAGGRVVISARQRVALIEVATGATLATCRLDDVVRNIAFAPDGHAIAIAGHYQNVFVLNAETLDVEQRLTGHMGPVCDVAWAPDGTTLASVSEDGTLRLWPLDGRRGSTAHPLAEGDHSLATVAFTPDGRDVVVAGTTVQRFALHDPTVLRGHTSYVYNLAFSPDGARLASAEYVGADVIVWDAHTGAIRQRLPAPSGSVPDVAFSEDGRQIVARSIRETRVWDAESGERVGTHDGELDTFTRLIGHVPWGTGPSATSADGTTIAICNSNGIVDVRAWSHAPVATAGHLLDPETAARLRARPPVGQLTGHVGQVWTAAFSPDDTRIATGGVDGTVRIWDAVTYEQLVVLRGHTQYVKYVVFSPDGTMLASASGDTTIRLWDTVPLHERRAQARR